jgi:alkaline phosphatase D
VQDVPIEEFDADGLGVEPNNLAAIRSLVAYRAFRYGRHLDLIVTDQRSFRSQDPFGDPSLAKLGGSEFLGMFPEDAMRILDGGRAFDGGRPPPRSGSTTHPSPIRGGMRRRRRSSERSRRRGSRAV